MEQSRGYGCSAPGIRETQQGNEKAQERHGKRTIVG